MIKHGDEGKPLRVNRQKLMFRWRIKKGHRLFEVRKVEKKIGGKGNN